MARKEELIKVPRNIKMLTWCASHGHTYVNAGHVWACTQCDHRAPMVRS